MTYWIKDKNDNEWPVRFTQGVIVQLAVLENISQNQFMRILRSFSEWPVERLFKLYWLMFKSGARAEAREFSLTLDEFILWVTEDDDTIIPQVFKAIGESQPKGEAKKKPSTSLR